jgi:hypothetical protein
MPDPEILPPEEDVREVPLTSDALAVLNRSEIEQQVEISRKYPRSVDSFRTKLEKYACLNAPVALSMFYSMPRADKMIVGPSVRFAETLLPCWGNSRAGYRILGEQGNVTTAQGIYFDCEANVGINVEAQRAIVGKGNKKFNNDMIVTTGNAAASVAYRNAILRGVPRALWLDIYEKAKQTAVGTAESFVSQVNKAVEEFAKQGVTQVALLNTLGAPSIRDITADHILTMRTIFREIRDGEKTIEQVFGSPEDKEIAELMEQLGWNDTKARMSREGFKGKRTEHLAFLRTEVAKMGGGTTQKAADGTKTTKAPAKDKPGKPELVKEADTTTQTATSSTSGGETAANEVADETSPAATTQPQPTTAAAPAAAAAKPKMNW